MTVAFNQVPKDIEVTTVAVLPIDGKDCIGQVMSGQDIASFTEGALLGLYNVVERLDGALRTFKPDQTKLFS